MLTDIQSRWEPSDYELHVDQYRGAVARGPTRLSLEARFEYPSSGMTYDELADAMCADIRERLKASIVSNPESESDPSPESAGPLAALEDDVETVVRAAR